jgi:serine/threonine protein kinase/tetratricopeptide (TPR) repeat protein
MLRERWNEIKDKLHEALQLEPTRRAVYLAEAGATDPDLQKELESLIAFHERTGTDFLNAPWAQAASALVSQVEPDALLGQRVGSYQIMGQIGVGGMGEVYRAFRADDEYQKQVAIKLVRAGQNSDFVINRFKNERQILASLDHPNIAQLLDGGTTENGVPYFVMEVIDGLPIDQYCDTHKLPITERLKLFIQVCSAVQYAHQHLFIHRDIKPSNVLVTSEGVPKLLDFGIAKILEGSAEVAQFEPTLTFFRVLTPGYASPEQVKGATITTSSDIYSLGVVLYFLLTGRSPYQLTKPTSEEIARAVCEVEPEKPSAVVRRTMADGKGTARIALADLAALREGSVEKLSKRLRGDLDDIVLMALRKEPQRRYASVEQFEGDVRRHLENLPVIARKDTVRYLTSKFVTRHKGGVAAVVLSLSAVLVGMFATLREARIAQAQRARAERRFNDVRKVANWMIFDLPRPIRGVPGALTLEKMLYDHGLSYLDSLAAEAEGDVSLQRELAAGYKRLGDSQGSPYGGSLGDSPGAQASYHKSLQMRQRLVQSDPHNISDQVELAKTYRTIGALLYKTGDVQAGQDSAHKALEIIKPIAQAHDDNVDVLSELGGALLTVGMVDGDALIAGFVGNPSSALKYHLDAGDVYRKVEGRQPDVQLWREQTAFMDNVISTDYLRSGKSVEAIRYARESLQVLSALKGGDASIRAMLTNQKAAAHSKVGDALLFSGRYREAALEYRSELSLFKELADPKDPGSLGCLADGYINLGHAESLRGNLSAGLQLIRRGLRTLGPQRKTDPTDSEVAGLFGSALIYEGETLELLGDEHQALQSFERAVTVFESPPLAGKMGLNSVTAAASAKLANSQSRLGHSDSARETYNKALTVLGPRTGSEPATLQVQYVLLAIYAGMGDLAMQRTEHVDTPSEARSEACQWYQRSRDIWLHLPVRNSISPSGFRAIDFDGVATKLAKCNQILQQRPLSTIERREDVAPEK